MMEPLQILLHKYPELEPCRNPVEQAYRYMYECYRDGGKVLLCGNGGSAADCDHIVGELMKGFNAPRKLPQEVVSRFSNSMDDGAVLAAKLQGALPAISLSAHAALMTAYGNDVDPDMIYAQQVYGYAKPGDILVGISTSGNARNVCNALKVARIQGAITVGLTGREGGAMKELCDVTIRVPYDSTPDVQERHLPVYHALCLMLEQSFFGE